ncbi:uroporphyrinogen-III synthase [Candidatus Entotheonella palauensis]|nr:uroporphyrinogen-III synthase [Candidatus Entotheonella palauensis]
MTSPASSPASQDHVLQGKRVLVTRAREQASDLERQLQAIGAVPLAFPTIRIVPPTDDYAALDAALRQLQAFDWAVFTSVNGVKHVWQRLDALGLSTADTAHLRLAAIGPATARALTAKGLEIAVMPPHYVAESLLDAIPAPAGQRFLLARADIARDALRVGLQAAGAEVAEVPAYHTVQVEPTPEDWAALDHGVDIMTFTASSTVHHFVAQVGHERLQILAQHALVAAIGPITAETARDLGLRVDVVADRYTIEGLVDAMGNACQA